MSSRRLDTAAVDKSAATLARHADRTGRTDAPDLGSARTPTQPWGPPARGTMGADVVSPEVQAAARDWADGRPVSPVGSFLLAVQRRYGNRSVQRLLQRPRGRPPASPVPVLQPMLRWGSPGDRYERQADLIARRVAGRWPGQGSAGHDAGRGAGRRDRVEGGEAQASRGLEAPEVSIGHLAGGGRPLASTAARPMEQAFGVDFGRVRAHSDAGADDLCRWIGARAFTVGDHIFFRQGEPSEGASGRHLLAHELTHVVQQRGVVPPGGDASGYAGPASTASAPRNTIQAFWVKRGRRYYWRNLHDEYKFFQLPGETHSSPNHRGEEPVFVEPWDIPDAQLKIRPEIEPKAAPSDPGKRAKMRRKLKAGVIEDLMQIRRTKIGASLLWNLVARSPQKKVPRPPQKTVIKPSYSGPLPRTEYHLTGPRRGESDIRFYPDELYDAMELLEPEKRTEHIDVVWRRIPSDVALFHELVHAYHNTRETDALGILNRDEALNPIDIGIERREYQAVGLDTKDRMHLFSREPFTENKYRRARTPKLPLRDTYRIPYEPGSEKARRESLESESRSEGS
jgi:hypothetical protein